MHQMLTLSIVRELFGGAGGKLLRLGEHPISREQVEEIGELVRTVTHKPQRNRISRRRYASLHYKHTITAEGVVVRDYVASPEMIELFRLFEQAPAIVQDVRFINSFFMTVGDSLKPHDDRGHPAGIQLGAILGLNDNYEGGDLVFHLRDERIDRYRIGEGDLLFFNPYTKHQVTPVTSGERKTLGIIPGTTIYTPNNLQLVEEITG